eukprot:6177695-Lingulodinium_polyedra.AAC.1
MASEALAVVPKRSCGSVRARRLSEKRAAVDFTVLVDEVQSADKKVWEAEILEAVRHDAELLTLA